MRHSDICRVTEEDSIDVNDLRISAVKGGKNENKKLKLNRRCLMFITP